MEEGGDEERGERRAMGHAREHTAWLELECSTARLGKEAIQVLYTGRRDVRSTHHQSLRQGSHIGMYVSAHTKPDFPV